MKFYNREKELKNLHDREKLRLSYAYSDIGNYWEMGNQNEIDIVAVNDEQKQIYAIIISKKESQESADGHSIDREDPTTKSIASTRGI
jgi:hypothetical protein